MVLRFQLSCFSILSLGFNAATEPSEECSTSFLQHELTLNSPLVSGKAELDNHISNNIPDMRLQQIALSNVSLGTSDHNSGAMHENDDHRLSRTAALHAALTGPRLHIVSVTFTAGAPLAALVQQATQHTAPPDVVYSTVCDPGCAAATNGTLLNIVEMDDSAFPSGECRYNGEDCSGYRRAQMKFLFGVRHEVRRLVTAGLPLPQWFMVKDDDTYVDIGRILDALDVFGDTPQALSLNEVTPAEESSIKSSMSPLSVPSVTAHGGGGWILSRELARRLAVDEGGEQCVKLLEKHIQQDPSRNELEEMNSLDNELFGHSGAFCYDIWVPTCVDLMNGTLINTSMLYSHHHFMTGWLRSERTCPPANAATFHLGGERKELRWSLNISDADEEALLFAAQCLRKSWPQAEAPPLLASSQDSPDCHVMYATTAGRYSYIGLMTSMVSLARNLDKPEKCVLHLLLPEEDLALADNITKWFNNETGFGPKPSLFFHRLYEPRFEIGSNSVGQERLAGNTATFSRWYAADLYMPNVSRVLWVDTDAMVTADVGILFDLHMDYALAAVRQPLDSISKDFNGTYFHKMPDDWPLFEEPWVRALSSEPLINAGVILMDLDLWRSEGVLLKLEKLAHRVMEGGQGVDDQLVLNLLFQGPSGGFHELDWSWNVMNLGYSWMYPCTKWDVEPFALDAKIIHFSGDTKPWSTSNGSLQDCAPFRLHAPAFPNVHEVLAVSAVIEAESANMEEVVRSGFVRPSGVLLRVSVILIPILSSHLRWHPQ